MKTIDKYVSPILVSDMYFGHDKFCVFGMVMEMTILIYLVLVK